MTITYSSSRRELASWYWYSLRHNPKHLRAWLLTLLPIAVLVFLSERQSGMPPTRAIVISAMATLAFAVLLALYPQLRFKPQVRTLTIAPDGINTTINARSKSYRWSDVASVTEAHDRIHITLANANAFVVPSRAFSSPERQQEFARQCGEWWKASIDQPAA